MRDVEDIGPHDLGYLPDLGGIRRREDLETISRDQQIDVGSRERLRAVDDSPRERPRADPVLVAGEAQEAGVAGFHVHAAGGRQPVDHGIRSRGLGGDPDGCDQQQHGRDGARHQPPPRSPVSRVHRLRPAANTA